MIFLLPLTYTFFSTSWPLQAPVLNTEIQRSNTRIFMSENMQWTPHFTSLFGQVWWPTSLITMLRKQRKRWGYLREFEVSLDYIASSRISRTTNRDAVSENKRKRLLVKKKAMFIAKFDNLKIIQEYRRLSQVLCLSSASCKVHHRLGFSRLSHWPCFQTLHSRIIDYTPHWIISFKTIFVRFTHFLYIVLM